MRGRRRRARCIAFNPSYTCFKPCGVRGQGLDTVELRADELEALRLTDHEGLYQEECAQRMGVSRTTLSRMLTEARRKVADALLHGKRLLIASEPSAAVTAEAEGPAPCLQPADRAVGAAGQPAVRGGRRRRAAAR